MISGQSRRLAGDSSSAGAAVQLAANDWLQSAPLLPVSVLPARTADFTLAEQQNPADWHTTRVGLTR